jgi:hypothetical protein
MREPQGESMRSRISKAASATEEVGMAETALRKVKTQRPASVRCLNCMAAIERLRDEETFLEIKRMRKEGRKEERVEMDI